MTEQPSALDNVPAEWFEEAEDTALAPIDTTPTSPVWLFSSLNIADGETPEEIRQNQEIAYWMLSGKADDLTDHVNESIELRHVIVYPVEKTDQKTGEVRRLPRIVILDSLGNLYQVYSKWTYRSLEQLVRIFGPPPYDPPLAVQILQTKRDGGGGAIILGIGPPASVLEWRKSAAEGKPVIRPPARAK